MIIVIAVLLFSLFPAVVVNMFKGFLGDEFEVLYVWATAVLYFNSSINPVIYFVRSSEIRSAIRSMIHCWKLVCSTSQGSNGACSNSFCADKAQPAFSQHVLHVYLEKYIKRSKLSAPQASIRYRKRFSTSICYIHFSCSAKVGENTNYVEFIFFLRTWPKENTSFLVFPNLVLPVSYLVCYHLLPIVGDPYLARSRMLTGNTYIKPGRGLNYTSPTKSEIAIQIEGHTCLEGTNWADYPIAITKTKRLILVHKHQCGYDPLNLENRSMIATQWQTS